MAEKKFQQKEEDREVLVRILGYDIPGQKKVYPGLTRIKGVSWAVSNFICLKLAIPRDTLISELGKEKIAKIEEFVKSMKLPKYMMNRRFEPASGEDKHLLGTDLDIAREFDIKRMKKIKSYKGMRHTMGQPVRGQRTRSHFRKKGGAVGVKKKK